MNTKIFVKVWNFLTTSVSSIKMIKCGTDMVVEWIWRLCNMSFESGVLPEDWRSAVIAPLYKGKGERTE